MTLKEISKSLSDERIKELVRELSGGDDYQETSDAIIFRTICHNEDARDGSYKLYYYKENKMFHCYTSCGDNFDIFELFKRRYDLLGIEYDFFKDIVLKIDGRAAIKEKNGFKNEYKSPYEMIKERNIEVNLPILNNSLLNVYNEFYTPEWLSDGINVEQMKLANIKYSIRENKIIIPHYDFEGNLIGIRGRALNPEDIKIGKYMPVKIGGKIYSHPLEYNLYGLNLVKDNIKKLKIAIVAESEKSVLQLGTMIGSDKNFCVASCGCTFHEYQLDLLLKAGAEKVIIAYDKEGETYDEKKKDLEKIMGICKRYKHKCGMGFIYDYDGILELKQSPFDRGKEAFTALYKKTRWI